MERAENLARILDVNESFARDSSGAQDWRPIVQLHNDDEPFFKRHKQANAETVVNFYVIDRKNTNSIVYSVWAARENARSLRHLTSIEVWSQLNVFYEFMRGLRDARPAPRRALAAVQGHQGRLPAPHRHHRGHDLSRPGLGVLPARQDDRARRPDDAAARHQIPSPAAAGGRCRLADRRQPMERAAALRRRLSRLPPRPPERDDAGDRGGLHPAATGIPALGHRLHARNPQPAGRARARPGARRGADGSAARSRTSKA